MLTKDSRNHTHIYSQTCHSGQWSPVYSGHSFLVPDIDINHAVTFP